MTNMSSQMNEVHRRASGSGSARGIVKVARMIERARPSDRSPRDPRLKEDTTMLKTISAALLAVSVHRRAGAGRPIRQGFRDRASAAAKTAPAPAVKTAVSSRAEAERAERQCQDGPPSRQASPPSSLPQARWARSRRSSKVGQAGCARDQARLNVDPRVAVRSTLPRRTLRISGPVRLPLLPRWRRAGAFRR